MGKTHLGCQGGLHGQNVADVEVLGSYHVNNIALLGSVEQVSGGVQLLSGLQVSDTVQLLGGLQVYDGVQLLGGLQVYDRVQLLGGLEVSDGVQLSTGRSPWYPVLGELSSV